MRAMSPLVVCLVIAAAAGVAVWLLSLITREYSWVDRIWSIAPIAYVWVFAAAAGLADARLNLMASLVTAWGVRLTFNYARKGGYAPGGEDYRWSVLRSKMRPWQFQVFNLLFIAVYQNALILGFTLPAWTASDGAAPFGVWDVVLAVVFTAFLAGETLADQQQWTFHRWKAAEIAAGRTPSPRFLQSGLFRFSRHPNFFFEQAQWWVFYGFAVAATGVWLHWTIAGPLLLTLLFIGSTMFTEWISKSRYPEYAGYQAGTSMLVPLPPRRSVRAAQESSA
jgi:steroid 5-alpha reductase family enzyme